MARSCLGLAAASALTAAATPPAGAAPNAAALYHEAIATTRDWTVHYVSTSTISHVTFVTSGDAGPASGTQTILVGEGATEESASLIEIGDLTYLKGNPLALEQLAGLSVAQATIDMGEWISFSTNNPTYAQVVAGVRSHDVAQETALNGPYAFDGSQTLHGQKVDAVRGTQQDGSKKVKFVLYVRASGRHLLVEEDALGAGGKASGAEHIVFSRWGEPVRPRAPHASLSLGSINAVSQCFVGTRRSDGPSAWENKPLSRPATAGTGEGSPCIAVDTLARAPRASPPAWWV